MSISCYAGRRPFAGVRFLGLVLLGLLAPSVGHADDPSWWHTRGVVVSTDANNLGVANIGQGKWMAEMALAELAQVAPVLAEAINLRAVFPAPPDEPDAVWYANQRAAINVGQLKALAKPFYDALPSAWTAGQRVQSGLVSTTGNYPWNPDTPREENLSVAVVGQVKVVFALRFDQSLDGDSTPDLRELAYFGTSNLSLDLDERTRRGHRLPAPHLLGPRALG